MKISFHYQTVLTFNSEVYSHILMNLRKNDEHAICVETFIWLENIDFVHKY